MAPIVYSKLGAVSLGAAPHELNITTPVTAEFEDASLVRGSWRHAFPGLAGAAGLFRIFLALPGVCAAQTEQAGHITEAHFKDHIARGRASEDVGKAVNQRARRPWRNLWPASASSFSFSSSWRGTLRPRERGLNRCT